MERMETDSFPEIENFEYSHCAHCKKDLSIAQTPNPGVGLCLDCERMILSYQFDAN